MDPRQKALIKWINSQPDFSCDQLQIVSGDASFRRYFRFDCHARSIIAVDAPPEFEDSQRFVQVAQAYSKYNVPVPKVLSADFSLGFYCLEDFGDKQFADDLSIENCREKYTLALSYLPDIQACQSTEVGLLPKYDEALLSSEFYLFSHWLVEIHLNMSPTEDEKSVMQNAFAFLQKDFMAQPQVGVHRDYHSRNLMELDEKNLGIIDFQDAVIGPVTYDAVSLLRDCYQDWPDEIVIALLKDFHQQHYTQYSWLQFKRWFDLTGMQRHIKASGIFARLCHRDGKSSYLNDIPHTLNYLIEVGQNYPELSDFVKLVRSKVKPMMETSIA